MENIKQILNQTNKLQEFAINRGEEKLRANGIIHKIIVNTISFYDDEIFIYFEEDRYTDCPDINMISLNLYELELNDIEWATYIEEIKHSLTNK